MLTWVHYNTYHNNTINNEAIGTLRYIYEGHMLVNSSKINTWMNE